ncbi:hypothetical protein [Pseudanabaena sp. PCC 6802]|uniref:hypothetical protein n=1 Tax=Pseudanabaena sp. PCC 6802 TaxID=118173 RepID=UPI00034D69C1|nr:hypothetical protein [Pseudanabaena sp. PCC 6802]
MKTISPCTQFPSARNRDRVPILPYHEYCYEDDFDGTETHYLIVDFDTYWSDGRNTGYFAKALPLPEPQSTEEDWQEYELWLDEQEERHRLASEITQGNW